MSTTDPAFRGRIATFFEKGLEDAETADGIQLEVSSCAIPGA
jgi:hypothetical protein